MVDHGQIFTRVDSHSVALRKELTTLVTLSDRTVDMPRTINDAA